MTNNQNIRIYPVFRHVNELSEDDYRLYVESEFVKVKNIQKVLNEIDFRDPKNYIGKDIEFALQYKDKIDKKLFTLYGSFSLHEVYTYKEELFDFNTLFDGLNNIGFITMQDMHTISELKDVIDFDKLVNNTEIFHNPSYRIILINKYFDRINYINEYMSYFDNYFESKMLLSMIERKMIIITESTFINLTKYFYQYNDKNYIKFFDLCVDIIKMMSPESIKKWINTMSFKMYYDVAERYLDINKELLFCNNEYITLKSSLLEPFIGSTYNNTIHYNTKFLMLITKYAFTKTSDLNYNVEILINIIGQYMELIRNNNSDNYGLILNEYAKQIASDSLNWEMKIYIDVIYKLIDTFVDGKDEYSGTTIRYLIEHLYVMDYRDNKIMINSTACEDLYSKFGKMLVSKKDLSFEYLKDVCYVIRNVSKNVVDNLIKYNKESLTFEMLVYFQKAMSDDEFNALFKELQDKKIKGGEIENDRDNSRREERSYKDTTIGAPNCPNK